MSKRIDLLGKRVGKLVVVKDYDDLHWECRCDCGGIKIVKTGNLTTWQTKSCGCIQPWNNKDKIKQVNDLVKEGKKLCLRCDLVKNVDDFHKLKCIGNGYNSWCKECEKARYLKKKENIYRYTATRMRQDIKQRAKKKNIPFDLTKKFIEDKISTGKCEVTKLPFVFSKNIGNIYSPSVDRVDPNMGYLESNCRIVILGFNMLKYDASDIDCKLIALKIVENLDVKGEK